MQLVIAYQIPAPGIEAGFAGQGVPFAEQGIMRQGERPGRKRLFNAKTKPVDVLTPAPRKDKI